MDVDRQNLQWEWERAGWTFIYPEFMPWHEYSKDRAENQVPHLIIEEFKKT